MTGITWSCVFVIPNHLSLSYCCWSAVYNSVQLHVCHVCSWCVSRRCDGDEGLTWQVLCEWSWVRLWIEPEKLLRKVRLLTLCTRQLSQYVNLYRPLSYTTDVHTQTHTQILTLAWKEWPDFGIHHSDQDGIQSTAGLHFCYIRVYVCKQEVMCSVAVLVLQYINCMLCYVLLSAYTCLHVCIYMRVCCDVMAALCGFG